MIKKLSLDNGKSFIGIHDIWDHKKDICDKWDKIVLKMDTVKLERVRCEFVTNNKMWILFEYLVKATEDLVVG